MDFEIGDRVVPSIDVICGRCEFCLRGETNRCANLTRIGYERNGGMGALVNAPAANLEKMAGKLSFVKAAVITNAVASMHRAIRSVGQVSAGSRIAILGIGGLGMQGVKIAELLGANVTCTSRNEENLEKTKYLGADHVINTKKENYL